MSCIRGVIRKKWCEKDSSYPREPSAAPKLLPVPQTPSFVPFPPFSCSESAASSSSTSPGSSRKNTSTGSPRGPVAFILIRCMLCPEIGWEAWLCSMQSRNPSPPSARGIKTTCAPGKEDCSACPVTEQSWPAGRQSLNLSYATTNRVVVFFIGCDLCYIYRCLKKSFMFA